MLSQRELELFEEAITVASTKLVIQKAGNKLATKLAAFFRRQGALYLKNFSKLFEELQEADTNKLDTFFDRVLATTVKELENIIQVAVSTELLAAAQATIVEFELGISFDLKNALAIRFLKNYGASRVTGINDTSKERIRSVVTGGLEQGLSYQKVAKQIRDLFQDFSKKRARLIAVTEMATAHSAGNNLAVAASITSGLTFEKRWATVGDSRVTPQCEANAGEGWIAFAASHNSGDLYPPRFPGCRCVEVYRRQSNGQ